MHLGDIDMVIDEIVGRVSLPVGRPHRRCLAGLIAVIAALLVHAGPVRAQLIDCPPQVDLAKHKLPEIVSANGRLRGLLTLSDAQNSFQIGAGKCVPQLLRFFQKDEPTPPDPDKAMAPLPGPTLRARLGDIVELTFLNQIDPLDYGNSIDRWENLKGDPESARCRLRFQYARDIRSLPPGHRRSSTPCLTASTDRAPATCIFTGPMSVRRRPATMSS